MSKCRHAKPETVLVSAGRGVQWCPRCGALRDCRFLPMKRGGEPVVGRWRSPMTEPHRPTRGLGR